MTSADLGSGSQPVVRVPVVVRGNRWKFYCDEQMKLSRCSSLLCQKKFPDSEHLLFPEGHLMLSRKLSNSFKNQRMFCFIVKVRLFASRDDKIHHIFPFSYIWTVWALLWCLWYIVLNNRAVKRGGRIIISGACCQQDDEIFVLCLEDMLVWRDEGKFFFPFFGRYQINMFPFPQLLVLPTI